MWNQAQAFTSNHLVRHEGSHHCQLVLPSQHVDLQACRQLCTLAMLQRLNMFLWYNMTTNMDKSLGTNLHLSPFFTSTKQTVTCEFNYICLAPPPAPPTMLDISPTFYGVGGGVQKWILKRITEIFQAPFLNTDNSCNDTSVPRNFVHHCRCIAIGLFLCRLPQLTRSQCLSL